MKHIVITFLLTLFLPTISYSQATTYCSRCRHYVNLPHSTEECEVYRSLGNGAPAPSAGAGKSKNLQQIQGAQQLGAALGSLLGDLVNSRLDPTPPPDLNSFEAPAKPTKVIAPPTPDPRQVEEQKRLQEMKNQGLDKVTWDDAVNSYRKQLTPEQKATFDSELKKLTAKNEWDSFQESQSGAPVTRGTEKVQATQLPEYKTRQQALDEWNNFATENQKSANSDPKTSESASNEGVLKWKNGPVRKPGESEIDYHKRLRDWQDKEDYEESRKRNEKEFYKNIEEGKFPKATTK